MLRIFIILVASLYCKTLVAFQKNFEGVIEYQNEVKSNLKDVSDRQVQLMMVIPKKIKLFIKDGRYMSQSENRQSWSLYDQNKTFIRFNGIDTLFSTTFNSDTSALTGMKKPSDKKTIVGYECNRIAINTSNGTHTYFYSPLLPLNPEHIKENLSGSYDAFIREAHSIWLMYQEEQKSYSSTSTAISVTPGNIDDSLFVLPNLPIKPFAIESIVVSAEFTRPGGFMRYVGSNINANIAAKFVKIPKGETEGRQTVIVQFVVTERGQVENVEIVNRKEVHSKLAEEALRVVSESPNWKPATMLGEKVRFGINQPITFVATK